MTAVDKWVGLTQDEMLAADINDDLAIFYPERCAFRTEALRKFKSSQFAGGLPFNVEIVKDWAAIHVYKWTSLAARDAASATWLAQQADEIRQAKRARTGDGAPTSQPRANDTSNATLSETMPDDR